MTSASSNARSRWSTKPCKDCGLGEQIPTKAGSNAKFPGRYYYKCIDKQCKGFKGFCDEHQNDALSGGDTSRKVTRPNWDLKDDLHTLNERMLAIENGVCPVIVIGILIVVGIVIIILQLGVLLCLYKVYR